MCIRDRLRRRRLRLLGHCLRSHGRGNSVPLALTILHRPKERLRRGQARTTTAIATYNKDLTQLGMNQSETVLCPPLSSLSACAQVHCDFLRQKIYIQII